MSALDERARRQIALLAGEDLEDDEAQEARRSIEACPECRAHWVGVRGCLDVLDRVARTDAPAPAGSLWPEIEAKLRPNVVVRRSEERFNGWVPALSMAAACIALLIAGQMEGAAPHEASAATEEDPIRATPMPLPQMFEPSDLGGLVSGPPLLDEPNRGGVVELTFPRRSDPLHGALDPTVWLTYPAPGR